MRIAFGWSLARMAVVYKPQPKGSWLLCVAGFVLGACSGSSGSNGGAAGGSVSIGGATSNGGHLSAGSASGGIAATGGAQSAGGTVANGGANTGGYSSAIGGAMTGGAPSVGGVSSTGGARPTGGSVSHTGGANNAGGTASTGGVLATGGAMPTGGTISTTGARATGGAGGTGGARTTGGTSAAGGTIATGGTLTGSSGATTDITSAPCDIYATGNTPCVAAHSTVRALYGSYSGNLYQVRRASDSTTKDIGVISAGGIANSAAQDSFCSGTTCVITIVYDQSGHGNQLEYQGSGSSVGGQDQPASATTESLNVSGHKVYPLYVKPGNSYWRDGHTTGIPTGSAPEGMYMVTNGKHYNSGCCFDYGNSETDRKADGAGAMDAINFSNTTTWGTGAGSGPWVMADLEYGLFSQGSSAQNTNDPTQTSTYVTALLKNNGTTEWALKGADATFGSLSTYYKGALPAGWSPMKKQGAIVLGSGGDCCATNTNQSQGTFYEGAIVTGYPSDATDNSIQSNIVAAGYGL